MFKKGGSALGLSSNSRLIRSNVARISVSVSVGKHCGPEGVADRAQRTGRVLRLEATVARGAWLFVLRGLQPVPYRSALTRMWACENEQRQTRTMHF